MADTMDFKYGDLVTECGQCGHIDTIDTYITSGIDIMLFNKHDSFFRVKCTNCGAEITVRLVPSANADEDIITPVTVNNDEELPQESPSEETI